MPWRSLDREAQFPVDLGSDLAVRAAADQVLERMGRCDVLVHAAAAFDRSALEELDAATWHRVQAVNVESALWLAHVPGMAERRFGRIVMIATDTVWNPPAPDLLAYVASKAALIGVARSLSRSLGPSHITVNCVAPGLTRTPTAETGMPTAAFERVLAQQALPRTLIPEDVGFVSTGPR